MSWLSIPIPNFFKSDESDKENFIKKGEETEEVESTLHPGGVKEDFSELGKTIGRQLRGVASFLAPPPVTAPDVDEPSDSSSQTFLGIRNDFAEISGSFKSGLSRLSTNKAVTEISKLASNILQFPKEEDEDGSYWKDSEGAIVGVTEDVLGFAQEMSMRSECWTDFPLSLDSDFSMSDAQREHSSTVEKLVPSLASLRLSLCPNYINDRHFWMIYFILLHPRLSEHDLKLLSTPQIVEARNTLLQRLQNETNTQVLSSKPDESLAEVSNRDSNVLEENNPVQEKQVLAETVSTANQVEIDEQDTADQWLEEDAAEATGTDANIQLRNEEEVSFSDLEDNDSDDVSSKKSGWTSAQHTGTSSPNHSHEWIKLSENSDSQGGQRKPITPTTREKDSEGEESNDWLTIDDFDSDSLGTA